MAQCLVVRSCLLFELGFLIKGFNPLSSAEIGQFLELVAQKGEFRERYGPEGIEENDDFQQIIPYAVIHRDQKFFIYQRGGRLSHNQEIRLENLWSAGVGGHIEPLDSVELSVQPDLLQALFRELEEEVVFNKVTLFREARQKDLASIPKLQGLLKDDNEVGRVHLGVVFEIACQPGVQVSIREEIGENVSGRFVTLDQYQELVQSGQIKPETWTEIVVEKLLAC